MRRDGSINQWFETVTSNNKGEETKQEMRQRRAERAKLIQDIQRLETMVLKGAIDLEFDDFDTDEEVEREAIKQIRQKQKEQGLEVSESSEEDKSEADKEEDQHEDENEQEASEEEKDESGAMDGGEEDDDYEESKEARMEHDETDEADDEYDEGAEVEESEYDEAAEAEESEDEESKLDPSDIILEDEEEESEVGDSLLQSEATYEEETIPTSSHYGPSLMRKTKARSNPMKKESYVPLSAKRQMNNMMNRRRGIKNKKKEKDLNDKRKIESSLRNNKMQRDAFLKRVNEKAIQKEFKIKARDAEIDAEMENIAKNKARDMEVINEEKRHKIMTKKYKGVSSPAEHTDPEEDLDMTPEYRRNRDIYEDEVEDVIIKKKPYYSQKIMRGQTRGQKGWFRKKVANTQEATGVFKCISLIQTPNQDAKALYEEYRSFMEPVEQVCRIYILKGKSLTPNDDKNSDPYLTLRCGAFLLDDSANAISDTNNPGFYKCFDVPCRIPGESTLTIKVFDADGFARDDLIGRTTIDLEERYFSKDWQEFNQSEEKKNPIEERTLMKKTSVAPQGVLQCWIELMTPKEAKIRPKVDIRPFPKKPFELRVIVWGTKDVKFKDSITDANDLYCKGKFGRETLETDTHWRCREKGSFNWRWKYKLTYPFDYDEEYGRNIFIISLWDRDITKSNEMICEARLDLNDYEMLTKAYKRNARVPMKKIHPESNKKSDRMWLVLTHPDCKDEITGEYKPQGYIEISVEALPQDLADKLSNGFGREARNMYPVLPPPTGRFNFDFFSPWKMLKELLGPKLAKKCVCV